MLFGSTVAPNLTSQAKAHCPNRTRAQGSPPIPMAESPLLEGIGRQAELLAGPASRALPRQRGENRMNWFGSTLGWAVGLQPEQSLLLLLMQREAVRPCEKSSY